MNWEAWAVFTAFWVVFVVTPWPNHVNCVQVVQPDVPIGRQMWAIFPTALILAAIIYTGYVAIGAGLGRLAPGTLTNVWLRRAMAVIFIGYGVALGTSQPRLA